MGGREDQIEVPLSTLPGLSFILRVMGEDWEKVDWKFVVVLAVHLMAVGVMYGKITSEVAGISQRAVESRQAEEDVRKALVGITVKLTSLESSREEFGRGASDLKVRMDRLESETWSRKGGK